MRFQIQFYWDIYFILNFIMNLFLISMTGLLRRKCMSGRRIFLAAFTGSVQMTIFCVLCLRLCMRPGPVAGLPWQQRREFSILLLAGALLIAWEMLQISFREKIWRECWRDLFSFFQISILTGGALFFCLEWLGDGVTPHLWLILAGTCGIGSVLFWIQRMSGRREQQKHVMDGILYMGKGRGHPLRVLMDTGNQLVSPYSGEPVMILSEATAMEMGIGGRTAPLWIPFHSIGGDGVLPAYRIERLVLQDGRELHDFLAAVSPDLSADPTIQMILHSED